MANGEKLFKKCASCHTYNKGGENKVGPAMWGIVNRTKASSEGFAYSGALANFGGEYIDVMGIEPNVNKLKAAIERGINLKFLDLETHQEMYDVISAIGVYSHLPNPPEDIAKWCEMLNEGGELLIQAVDSATLSLENQHKPYSLPDHFSFTSKKLLIQLLQGLDMEVIQVESYRLPQYPVFSSMELFRQIGRMFMPGRSANFNFSPKYPDGDLWIRAKKRVL